MTGRYLITPSLHSAWHWFQELDSKTKQDFLDTLNKKEFEKTEAMKDGIAFEEAVHGMAHGDLAINDGPYVDCVREVAEIVKDGLWQERVYTPMHLCNMDFLLYGKADVIKRDWVYDFKFTDNYEIGKYQTSVQHWTYMLGSGLRNFAYLISDGKSVWREDYFWCDLFSEPDLLGKLADMVDGIMADAEFREAYLAKWGAK